MERFVKHYETQVGGSHSSGLERVYAGSFQQRGHGVGSFLGGLWRQALPLLRTGARTLGKEALSTSARVISDVVDHDAPLLEAVRTRAMEAKKNLKRKAINKISTMMSGSGYKASRARATAQLRAALRAKRLGSVKKRKTTKRKATKRKASRKPGKRATKKRKLEDIFA